MGFQTVSLTMLSSVADFRAYAKMTDSNFDYLNSTLVTLLGSNTRRIWKRLGADMSLRFASEYYDVRDEDENEIITHRWPIIAIAAITIHVPGSSSDSALASSGYEISGDALRVIAGDRFARAAEYQGVAPFGEGLNRVHIHYQAGYTDEELLPLKLACWAETAAWLNRSGYEGLESMREDKVSLKFESNGWSNQANVILRDFGGG